MMKKVYTAEELAQCAEREVKLRQRLYAWKVQQRDMSAEFAADQIGMMQQIASEYRAKAQAEAAKEDLFGGRV